MVVPLKLRSTLGCWQKFSSHSGKNGGLSADKNVSLSTVLILFLLPVKLVSLMENIAGVPDARASVGESVQNN